LAVQRRTHVQWNIIAVVTAIMLVTAFGRLNVSIAGKYLQDEFQFSTLTMGWILGAFAFGYALFQIPWGWAGDRFGPRATLSLGLLWWSVFTILMTCVPLIRQSHWWNYAWAFAAARFLTGMGEAASYPNANKIIAAWTTRSQRGIGSALLLGGVAAGGIVSPILFVATIQHWGWRSSFFLPGILAVVVAIVWFSYATDKPQQHPDMNSVERSIFDLGVTGAGHHSFRAFETPWKKIFSNRSVWALVLSYLCHGYTPYIYFTWFFIYLTRVRGFTLVKGGLWSATPFIVMTIMAPLGGWLSDKAVIRIDRRRGRQITVWIGMTSAALLLLAGSHAANNVTAVLLLAAAAGFSQFAAPSWWAACIDLAPEHSGSLSGLMNTCANLAGGFAPILTGYLATRFSWTTALDFAAVVNLAAGVIWVFVNVEHGVEADVERAPAQAQWKGTSA
jgi:ACS family glucarate transporter-like MFS transporter